MPEINRRFDVPKPLLDKLFKRDMGDYKLTFSTSCTYIKTTLLGNCGLGGLQSFGYSPTYPRFKKEEVRALGIEDMCTYDNWHNPPHYLKTEILYSKPWAILHQQACDTAYEKLFKDINDSTDYNAKAAWMISDNVQKSGAYYKEFKGSNFAKWLIKNRLGVIYAMPIGVNPAHSTTRDFSLIQTWYWIPPKALKFNVKRGIRRINTGTVPGREAFRNQWKDIMPKDMQKEFKL